MAAFERAMAALQRHCYEDAASQFRSLINAFPGERALLDRARVYLDLCGRELARRPETPRTVEERATAATAALNNDDTETAERLAREVLDSRPDHELALYLLAVVEARRGATNSALSFLSQAIAASPEIRAQARHDADFEALRSLDLFQQLIELPSHTPASAPAPGPRRLRLGRQER